MVEECKQEQEPQQEAPLCSAPLPLSPARDVYGLGGSGEPAWESRPG